MRRGLPRRCRVDIDNPLSFVVDPFGQRFRLGNALVDRIPVGSYPTASPRGSAGSFWTAAFDDGSLLRLDLGLSE